MIFRSINQSIGIIIIHNQIQICLFVWLEKTKKVWKTVGEIFPEKLLFFLPSPPSLHGNKIIWTTTTTTEKNRQIFEKKSFQLNWNQSTIRFSIKSNQPNHHHLDRFIFTFVLLLLLCYYNKTAHSENTIIIIIIRYSHSTSIVIWIFSFFNNKKNYWCKVKWK